MTPELERTEVRERLSADEVARVTEMVHAATEADGVAPLGEHVMLHLRDGGEPPARSLLLYSGTTLAGYAHLDPTDEVEGPSAEMVIDPAWRGQGQGRALVTALLTEAVKLSRTIPGDPGHRAFLRLWAHGELPAAAALATSMGFERIRALWQMRRPLDAPLPEVPLPQGVRLRTFEPGRDEDAWTEVNRQAFASHPEQGAWTVDDLLRREREPWFDPAGFFLAERDGRLAGFHWTKVHGDGNEHAHEPIGEVYVVGVAPSEQGTGLGRALTLAGLRHLRSSGLAQVMLYADEDNTPAIKLYESLGFARWSTDVMYRR